MAMLALSNQKCKLDPDQYVGECEIGQYGLCQGCLKGEYQSMGYGPAPTVNHSKRVCEYTLTVSKHSYHSNRKTAECAHDACRLPLEVGDRVVRKYQPGKSRLYHAKCAKELNII